MIFINWTTGFTALGIGSVIIVITMLVALIYYVWEVYNHD
jgi:Na+-transporting methylmalonyl-CoA/oxaloacetate decarboxylase gamma subunit